MLFLCSALPFSLSLHRQSTIKWQTARKNLIFARHSIQYMIFLFSQLVFSTHSSKYKVILITTRKYESLSDLELLNYIFMEKCFSLWHLSMDSKNNQKIDLEHGKISGNKGFFIFPSFHRHQLNIQNQAQAVNICPVHKL